MAVVFCLRIFCQSVSRRMITSARRAPAAEHDKERDRRMGEVVSSVEVRRTTKLSVVVRGWIL